MIVLLFLSSIWTKQYCESPVTCKFLMFNLNYAPKRCLPEILGTAGSPSPFISATISNLPLLTSSPFFTHYLPPQTHPKHRSSPLNSPCRNEEKSIIKLLRWVLEPMQKKKKNPCIKRERKLPQTFKSSINSLMAL